MTLTPSRAVTLAATVAASREFGTAPHSARVCLALWNLCGAAPTQRIAAEIDRPDWVTLGFLLDTPDDFAYFARGEWWLTTLGTSLVHSVFLHERELRQEAAAA